MKNRIVQTLLTFSIVASVIGGANTITANAADNVGKFDGQAAKLISKVFDAKYYAEMNPDVVAVFGTKEKALLNHYLTSGIYEGRDASAEFNADAYASANADLVAVYNSDNVALEYTNYFLHYVNCGKTEGRIATVADATNAGFTVVSASDETKVVAQPMLATKMVRNYNASAGGSSSSGSSTVSYSTPTSNDSSSTTTTTDSSTDSSRSSDSNVITILDQNAAYDASRAEEASIAAAEAAEATAAYEAMVAEFDN